MFPVPKCPKLIILEALELVELTPRIVGSKFKSIGFITMKTCWFLWVNPFGSLKAALQKYWTHPCFPKKVEGKPRGSPSLKGKL